MNTIDIHDGLVENLKWEAKKQAQLDSIYEKERSKYSSSNLYDDNYSNDNSRLDALEKRISKLERRVNKLYNKLVTLNEGNGLFVFAPNQNVKANVAFTLTENQFRELIESIKNN